jgi:hypothetical protein
MQNERGLIFSASGGTRKSHRVSPLLFPQYGLNNKYFLQKVRDLPEHGLLLRFQVFDFGYSVGAPVQPFDTWPTDVQIGRDFLVSAITGTFSAQAATAPPGLGADNALKSPGFLVTFLHTHDGVQRQWENKPITDISAVGDGEHVSLFKEPILLVAGDTLTCQLQNLSNVTLLAQILLIGGEFDAPKTGG